MPYHDTRVVHILDGKNKTNRQNRTEVEQARIIKRTLGPRVAARYLYKRGWSIDGALFALLGVEQKHEDKFVPN